MKAVETVLRRGGQAGGLDLEPTDLIHNEGHDQEDQAGEGDDDGDENEHDREYAGHAGGMQPANRGLNQKSDGRPQNEGAKKVPEQE